MNAGRPLRNRTAIASPRRVTKSPTASRRTRHSSPGARTCSWCRLRVPATIPVDVDACTAAGVLVVNQAGANAEAVAEHAVGFMLSLTKNIPQTDRYLRSDKRDTPREVFKGWNARGKTVGVVGLGNTGRRTVRICKGGLNMQAIAYDPYLKAEDFEERGVQSVSLEELMAQSDFISVHCPLNKETTDMIDAKELSLIKPGAFIVSCARGGIINEKALENALKDKTLAGAGLDVWVQEPPAADHPLLKLDNVLATYHTAGVTGGFTP